MSNNDKETCGFTTNFTIPPAGDNVSIFASEESASQWVSLVKAIDSDSAEVTIAAGDQDAIDDWFNKKERDGELNDKSIEFEEALALCKEELDYDGDGYSPIYFGNNKKKPDPKKAKAKAKAARKARKGKKK